MKNITEEMKRLAGKSKILYHEDTDTHFISDGLYLYWWNEDLQDWDDSCYNIRDEFYQELKEVFE